VRSPKRAKRPAGTRVALPGTLLRNRSSAVLAQWSKLHPYKIKISNAVRKHLPGLGQVGLVDQRQLLELAHALGSLGAQQVALAGMHAQNLAGRGDLEALLRAAMGLELNLASWNCVALL